jgi:isoamylase
VSYERKHNEDNGEDNRDGDNNNLSANYGVEGPTRRKSITRLRGRQIRNFLASLFLSQGVPMLLFGDECRRTQKGNNNAYCQDNATSWFDWNLVERNADIFRFCSELIAFRKRQPTVRHDTFLSGEVPGPGKLPDVSWYNANGHTMDWNCEDRSLVCLLGAWPRTGANQLIARDVMIMCHAGYAPREFVMPEPARKIDWRLFINTAFESPEDIYPDHDGPAPPSDGKLTLIEHSLVCYVSAL